MKNKVILSLAMLLFGFSMINAKKLKFKEDTVFDKKTGTTIMTDEKKEIMIITNLKYHYALVLPYYSDWKIEVEGDKYILFANHSRLNASINIYKNRHSSSKKYLEELKTVYEKNKGKYGIEKVKIFQYKKNYILATSVDVFSLTSQEIFKGKKQINYFCTKRYKNERFKLHLSLITDKSKAKLNNKQFFNFMTTGFNVDFQRKK